MRIERMMQMRSEYASTVEFEIEASKVHWSQLDETSDDEEEGNETDLEIFEVLKKFLKFWKFLKYPGFFCDYGDGEMVVGEKIAEGGQAEIFKARWKGLQDLTEYDVVKVFKNGYMLRDMEKLGPLGMLQNRDGEKGFYYCPSVCHILGGTLLKNGRFAFQMYKHWGALRKLIAVRMQYKGNQGPPFTNIETRHILGNIAVGMKDLHEHNVVHRDSNVLVRSPYVTFRATHHNIFQCYVVDYESSIGVVGTAYWRAPEVLHAVQTRDIKSHLFTEKSDVYAMTCYEFLTGCIPFEELDRTSYDVVIKGKRPDIPDQYVIPKLRTLLNRC